MRSRSAPSPRARRPRAYAMRRVRRSSWCSSVYAAPPRPPSLRARAVQSESPRSWGWVAYMRRERAIEQEREREREREARDAEREFYDDPWSVPSISCCADDMEPPPPLNGREPWFDDYEVCVCATRALASRARCCDARTRDRERWTRVPGAATHSFAISRVPTREARACVRRPHSDTCECSPSPASRPSPSLTRAGVCPACARYPGRAGLDVMRFRCVACVIYRLINR